MSATATVEEYHPEVVTFARRLRKRLDDREFLFNLDFVLGAVINGGDKQRDELTHFLLSECATPLPRNEGAAS